MTSSEHFSPGEMAMGYILLFLIYFLPFYIIQWKLYRKASQAGWKAIIPVYSEYVMGVITKSAPLGWVVGIVWMLYWILGIIGTIPTATGVVGLIWIVTALILLNKFIKQYDAGIGKWFLYIFIPILGVFLVNSTKFKGTGEGSQPVPPQPPSNSILSSAAGSITPTVAINTPVPPTITPSSEVAPNVQNQVSEPLTQAPVSPDVVPKSDQDL